MNEPINTDLQAFFDGIKDIEGKNFGGCLFFCYLFFLWLEKNKMPTRSFKIVQHDYDDKYYINRNIDFIRGDRDKAVSSWHFSWIYKGIEYDSEGTDPMTHFSRKVLALSNKGIIRSFCKSALIFGSWNSTFDRQEAIEHVIKTLDIDMSKELNF